VSIVAPALAQDADTLSLLHGRSFSDRWSASYITALLEGPGAMAFLAREGTQACGFILARQAADEAEILTLAVDPVARRRGTGRALVAAAAAGAFARGARAMFLEVESTNAAASGLYVGLGFREVGRRRGYYRDAPGMPARDALTLKAELPLGKPLENG
jgi:ribosomal-protein-alanine N-acetyltransferase